MTLPANDAFSFGLTGSHDPTRPAYTLSLRSTSPKIPFVSARARSPQPHPRRSARRAMSNGSASEGTGHGNEPLTSPHESVGAALARKTPSTNPKAKANGNSIVSVNGNAIANVARRPKETKSAASPPIDWEIPRKLLHSSIGFLTLYLYISHGSSRAVVVVLSIALCIIAPADVLRLNHTGFERIYEKYLGFLMRESEKKTTNGVIWYLIGVIWVLALYPLDVAVVSILILSWADTAASTIGRLWGRLTPPLPARVPILGLPLAPRKSVAGFIAGSLTGVLITAGFWGKLSTLGNIEPMWSWSGGVSGTGALAGWVGLAVLSLYGGLVSGVAEALDLGSLDDNLTLPIISGGCLLCFFKCLQYLFS